MELPSKHHTRGSGEVSATLCRTHAVGRSRVVTPGVMRWRLGEDDRRRLGPDAMAGGVEPPASGSRTSRGSVCCT
jgi:hypothetical protein